MGLLSEEHSAEMLHDTGSGHVFKKYPSARVDQILPGISNSFESFRFSFLSPFPKRAEIHFM